MPPYATYTLSGLRVPTLSASLQYTPDTPYTPDALCLLTGLMPPNSPDTPYIPTAP